MTSPSKLAANRANARRSTGPKSDVGKRRASQNARRHGLSIPIVADPNCLREITAIAKVIAGEDATPTLLELAKEISATQFDLLRVRRARKQLISRALADESFESKEQKMLRQRIFRLRSGLPPDSFQRLKSAVEEKPIGAMKEALAFSELSQDLAKFERYERRALSRRRRAIRMFEKAKRADAAGRRLPAYIVDLNME
jgi:hypothetical protein